MTEKTLRNGFIAAGLMNIIAVLILSKFFTNKVIPETDPAVMSNFGLLMIMVWGLAYIALANSFKQAKWVVGTFVVEKLVYVIAWIMWILNNDVSKVYEKDIFAGFFYSVYGINDFIFFVFFLYVFYKIQSKTSNY
tara:strand:+ start:42656 stop:43063 length:408 start_codon:yes stop_codon:yes gene_type:complete